MDLLKQSGESLAGRVEYVDMNPLDCLEVPERQDDRIRLWTRGGGLTVFWREMTRTRPQFENKNYRPGSQTQMYPGGGLRRRGGTNGLRLRARLRLGSGLRLTPAGVTEISPGSQTRGLRGKKERTTPAGVAESAGQTRGALAPGTSATPPGSARAG